MCKRFFFFILMYFVLAQLGNCDLGTLLGIMAKEKAIIQARDTLLLVLLNPNVRLQVPRRALLQLNVT